MKKVENNNTNLKKKKRKGDKKKVRLAKENILPVFYSKGSAGKYIYPELYGQKRGDVVPLSRC